MANYQVLEQDEQDDIIVSFMLAQERDKFCHELNLTRYNKILAAAEEGAWKKRISHLKGETVMRLAEVDSIIEAAKSELPSPARLNAAKGRVKAKETQSL